MSTSLLINGSNVNLDARLWKVHKHVAKVNKAYLIQ